MVAVPFEAESPSASVCFSDQTWGRGPRRCPWCQRPHPYSRHQTRSLLPSIVPHWSFVLALSWGLLPEGPRRADLCCGEVCAGSPENTPRSAGARPLCGGRSSFLCALTPWGCLWSSLPSLSVSERNSRHSLDSFSVRVSSLRLQFISERTLIGLKKIGCPSSLLT